MFIEYNSTTERITRRGWFDNKPPWVDKPRDGCDVANEPLSQQSRDGLIKKANNIHEAGTDYDPDTETSIGYLCYDAETGEIYPDAEIKPLPDEGQ